jgi:two-component system, LytTR family, response regulator
MIRCLIVDDENSAIEIIAHHVSKVPFLELIDISTSSVKALKMVNELNIDLIFLDVHMPEMNGIDFARAIHGKAKVILITGYSQYALDGYELNVVDYLLKPISFPRFMMAVTKANEMISANRNEAVVKDDHIFVQIDSKGKFVRIDFSSISYIESLKNYVAIYRGREKIMVSMGISEWENVLPKAHFIRIHKSYIISMNKIQLIESNQAYLHEIDKPIPFGGVYKPVFLEAIKNKVINK